jgi:phosphoribosylformylglycinamidine synthase
VPLLLLLFFCCCCSALTAEEKAAFAAMVHDRMTEQVYEAPAASFKVDAVPAPVFTVPVMQQGRAALEAINEVCYVTCYLTC